MNWNWTRITIEIIIQEWKGIIMQECKRDNKSAKVKEELQYQN